jgi:hypothetical protein
LARSALLWKPDGVNDLNNKIRAGGDVASGLFLLVEMDKNGYEGVFLTQCFIFVTIVINFKRAVF